MKTTLKKAGTICLAITGAIAFAGANVLASTVNVAPSGDIQSAINSVAAAGGGTVNITSGTATRSATLTMKSKVTVNGAGNPTTTLNAGGNFAMFVESADGMSNVGLQNIELVGQGGTGSNTCCGYLIESLSTSDSGISANNVQLANFGGIACEYKRCSSSSISSCNFHDSGTDLLSHNLYLRANSSVNVTGTSLNNSPYGCGYHEAGGSANDSLTTCTLNNNGEDGANIQDSPTGETLNGCTANGNRNATSGRSDGIGINAQSGSGTVENCTATGNRVNYQVGSGYTQSNNH